MVNNIRDIETDAAAAKRTLAVIIGREPARRLFVATVAVAYLTAAALWPIDGFGAWTLLAWLSIPFAVSPVRAVLTSTRRTDPERRAASHRSPPPRARRAARRRPRRLTRPTPCRIAGIRYRPFRLPLRTPIQTARAAIEHRAGVVIELTDASGHRGIGEASPMPEFGEGDAGDVLRLNRGTRARPPR